MTQVNSSTKEKQTQREQTFGCQWGVGRGEMDWSLGLADANNYK